MAEHSYTYSVIKSAWGIRVTVTAEVIRRPASRQGEVAVAPGLWLEWERQDHVRSEDHAAVVRGLTLMANAIQAKTSGESLTVLIRQIGYSDCDYQPEGLTAAVMGWVAAEFGLPTPTLAVAYHAASNRYEFRFGDEAS